MVDHTLDEALQRVKDADQGVDSLIAYNAVLKQRVTDALASENLSADTKAKINAIFDMSDSDASKAQAALDA